jgi:hypothetical protein
MPRPSKLVEEAKIKAWAVAHPKVIVPPGKSSSSDAAKLVRGLLGSGGGAIVFAAISEYLALAGVVDSLAAARLFLIFAGLVGFVGVLVSEIVWGKSRKTIVLTAIATAFVLSLGLWRLDLWTVRYRLAHAPPAIAPQTPSPNSGVVGLGVEGEGAILNDVVIDHFGSTGVANKAGKLSLNHSQISGERVGLDNQNPSATIDLNHSSISGEVGMINRGPNKADKTPKP